MNIEAKNLRELVRKIAKTSQQVFIVGHNDADYDSLSSAIGIQSLCTTLKKKAFIVVDDDTTKLSAGVKKIIDDNRERHSIISKEEFERIKEEDKTLIIVDANKKYQIPFTNRLGEFPNIIIIDHHRADIDTIDANYSYISINASSAAEIITFILMIAKARVPDEVYTCLLAGLTLDTKGFNKNTSALTHTAAKYLMEKGANKSYVDDLFLEEFDQDKIINDLVFNGTLFHSEQRTLFDTCNISFTQNRDNKSTIYKKESLAKAADRMLHYKVDASFVIGMTDENVVGVSARSKGNIDVGIVMCETVKELRNMSEQDDETDSRISGGGNIQNAGARIEGIDIDTIEEVLRRNVSKGIKYDIPTIVEQPEQVAVNQSQPYVRRSRLFYVKQKKS